VNHVKMNRRLKELFKIRLSIFHNNVDRVEVFEVGGLENFDNVNEIGMTKLTEKSNFSENTLAVDSVFENFIETLDSNLFSGVLLDSLNDVTIRTGSDLLYNVVVGSDIPILEGLGKGRKFREFFIFHNCVKKLWDLSY